MYRYEPSNHFGATEIRDIFSTSISRARLPLGNAIGTVHATCRGTVDVLTDAQGNNCFQFEPGNPSSAMYNSGSAFANITLLANGDINTRGPGAAPPVWPLFRSANTVFRVLGANVRFVSTVNATNNGGRVNHSYYTTTILGTTGITFPFSDADSAVYKNITSIRDPLHFPMAPIDDRWKEFATLSTTNTFQNTTTQETDTASRWVGLSLWFKGCSPLTNIGQLEFAIHLEGVPVIGTTFVDFAEASTRINRTFCDHHGRVMSQMLKTCPLTGPVDAVTNGLVDIHKRGLVGAVAHEVEETRKSLGNLGKAAVGLFIPRAKKSMGLPGNTATYSRSSIVGHNQANVKKARSVKMKTKSRKLRK